MTTHQIQLKRSPRTITVGDQTVKIDGTLRTPPPQAMNAASARAITAPVAMAATAESTTTENSTAAAALPPGPAPRTKASSVANVIANPVDRSVTPLSRSNAVPVLSNSAHEVVKAQDVGLGGVDPEEISRLQQLLADAAEAVVELQSQHRQSLSEMQEVAVELAVAAASWLVGVSIDKDMFAVDDLILKAFEHLELNQSVKVRLNPADHDLLQSLLRDPTSRKQLDEVSCVKDTTIARGTVRVESGRRILLTDMHSRLEEIRRSWMEKLDDSQIERRGDGSTSGTLRRFPERRETA